jgi:hypothetical protein
VPSNAATASGSNEASAGEPPISSGMLIMGSMMLALGLALVGVIWRVTRKDAAERRARILTDGPELDPYDDPEFYRKLREAAAPENPSVNRPVKEVL